MDNKKEREEGESKKIDLSWNEHSKKKIFIYIDFTLFFNTCTTLINAIEDLCLLLEDRMELIETDEEMYEDLTIGGIVEEIKSAEILFNKYYYVLIYGNKWDKNASINRLSIRKVEVFKSKYLLFQELQKVSNDVYFTLKLNELLENIGGIDKID